MLTLVKKEEMAYNGGRKNSYGYFLSVADCKRLREGRPKENRRPARKPVVFSRKAEGL